MPLSTGVNLRVTGHCNQGGRKYMEDMFSVAYQQTSDDKDLEYAFFGIFDGHGGGEAAEFAKEHLMDIIVKQKNFWSDKDEDVLRAIRDGYVNTHYAMWCELDKWPRTASGLPSTAGTTASVAFIRKGKIYIGHVGDSGIILGYQEEGDPQWKAKALTKDHKPESGPEMIRIQESGGKVVSKSGVPRVVWNRPRIGHKGPVRRSTHIDEIPFLAVARSLGDLWSYNSELDTFVVSPEPDVKVVAVDVESHRCLIFGTDGLWNMLSAQAAVAIVQAAERHNEKHLIASQQTGNGQSDVQMWINPSKSLVDRALERWSSTRWRADNTSVVTLMLDPPGPSRSEVILSQKKEPAPLPRGNVHPVFYAPVSSAPAAAIPKMIPRPATLCAPRSSQASIVPESDPEVIDDARQPDSSDGIASDSRTPVGEGSLDHRHEETTPAKIQVGFEESKKSDPTGDQARTVSDDTVATTTTSCAASSLSASVSVSTTSKKESIQVAEVSSSDTDERKRVETRESEPQSFPAEKTESSNVENVAAPDGKLERSDATSGIDLKILVEQVAVLERLWNVKNKEEPALSSGTVRMNVHSISREELKATGSGRLRRSSGSVNVSRTTVCKSEGTFSKSRDERRTTAGSNGLLNGSARRRHCSTSRSERQFGGTCQGGLGTGTRRRHSVTAVQVASALSKSREEKRSAAGPGPRFKHGALTEKNKSLEESRGGAVAGRTVGCGKRRHSPATRPRREESCSVPEPCSKRRTRSEDRPSPTDENDPSNQKSEEPHSRLRWPGPEPSSVGRGVTTAASTTIGQERLTSSNSFQKRSLKKKATPVKTIRRPSINGSNRSQLRGSFGGSLRDWAEQSKSTRTIRIAAGLSSTDSPPQRWLRSDTIAATPVKTLRSRNVDIAGHTVSAQVASQYGMTKQSRLSLPAKLKQSALTTKIKSSLSTGKLSLKQSGGEGIDNATSSGMAKRVKSPYNPGARTLGTRSRIKRLGK